MRKSKEIALGGMFTALSVIIMCFGTMFPFMTYASPLVCFVIGAVLLKIISRSGFVCWYFAVAILSLLLCPDKEAAAVFTVFGMYPLFRQWFEKLPVKWLFKLVYFNILTVLLYWFLMHVIGMEALIQEFEGVGTLLMLAMLLAGNLVFILTDLLLRRIERSKKYKRK